MNVEEWIGALRGGGYKHTAGVMHKPELEAHCALGVLCDIQGVEWIDTKVASQWDPGLKVPRRGYVFPDGVVTAGFPPSDWMEEVVGLTPRQVERVYLTNDVWGFEKAADVLKEYMNA